MGRTYKDNKHSQNYSRLNKKARREFAKFGAEKNEEKRARAIRNIEEVFKSAYKKLKIEE
jgi:hypothetical protein